MLSKVFVFAILVAGAASNKQSENFLRNSFRDYFETGQVSPFLKIFSSFYDLPGLINGDVIASDVPQPHINILCLTCATAVNQILDIAQNPNTTAEDITIRVKALCIELGLGNDIMCDGFVEQAEPEIVYIFQNSNDTNGNDICGTFLISLGCQSNNPKRIWTVELPDTPKPPVNEPPYPDIASVPTFKILHLADTHIDPDYAIGSNSRCEEIYLCCRNDSSGEILPGNEAGYWGDYGACDLPTWTLELLYAHAAQNHPDIDLIIWTGDHVPHNIWGNTRESNIENIELTFQILLNYFPSIPVISTVGNHEGHPVNTFPQPYVSDPEFDISWLYEELARTWTYWLPDSTTDDILYGAYYAVQIRPGLRAVVINSNYCYCFNWWLIMDSTDVAQALEFMANQLQSAEDAGESVYVISHMSSGTQDCEYTWSHEYNKIISRYEGVVVGTFHGHTHNDHYEIFFDPEDSNRPYEISFISPAQTTYIAGNPGYKIHIVEGDFPESKFRVLDQEVYILDLEVANVDIENAQVEKLYSFLETYGVPDMSPQSLTDLVYTMNEPNSTLFDEFYRLYNKAGADRDCDEECKSNRLCRLLISDNSDHSKCDTLSP